MLRRSFLLLLPLLLLPLVGGCGGRRGGSRPILQNKGSDTLLTVAQAWAERYRDVDSSVAVAVSGGGSGTGISALINGTVDIANASRKMKPQEYEAARAQGADPQEFLVGYDALAVYVHEKNPVTSFTLAQLAAVYGEGGEVDRWSQLGLKIPGCDSDEIVRVSRQNSSGTYAYFREAVLGGKQDYKLGSRDMHGSTEVVDLVEHSPCAIGYSGLAYATPHVKLVPIAAKEGDTPVVPSVETALDGSYPIARPLLMYTRTKPEGAVKAYLDWILSDAGQRILSEVGYAPVRKVD